jgi:hypothetical protein
MWLFFKGIGSALAGLAGMVPGWIWLAMFAGAMASNCTHTHQRDSARRDLAGLKAQVLEQETTRAEIARLAEAGRRAAEKTHTAELAAINRRTADEKNRLDAAVAAAIAGLQHRPDRPARGGAVPSDSAPAVACTGAQLYRPDAEFLVREAARADRVRINAADCQARYDAGVTLTGGWETYRKALIQSATSTTTPKGNAP